MNVVISVYGPDGYIRRTLDVPMRDALANIAPDEKFIEGAYDAGTTVVVDGVAKDIPPAPGPHHVYLPRLNAWVDLRSGEARAADATAALTARRAAAQLPKSQLLIGLTANRIISAFEMAELASWRLPPRLEPLLNDLPEDLRAVALARWHLKQSFGRTHPVIAAAALRLGIDGTTLDQIFGVAEEAQ